MSLREKCSSSLAALLLLSAAFVGLTPAAAQAQTPPDPDAPFLSEISPVAGSGRSPWVEITVGRVEPASVDTPLVGDHHLFLPVVQGGSQAVAATHVDLLASGENLAGWRIDDLDGNSYTLPGNLPALANGAVVLIVFDGQGAAADETDASDGKITLHTPAGVANIFEPGGDQLALFDASNTMVDFVAWGQPAGADDDAAAATGLWVDETYVVYDGGFGAGGTPSPTTPGESMGIWQDAPEQSADNWAGYSAANSTPGALNPPPAPLASTVPDNAVIGVDDSGVSAADASGAAAINPQLALGWSGMGSAFRYHFQLDDSPNFASPLADVTVGDPVWSGRVGEGELFWRVRTVDGRGKFSAFFGPYKVTVVNIGKFVSLGTVKTLLNANEYKIQHKDSPLLDIGGGPNNVVGANNPGDRRYPKDRNWDGEHVDANNVPRFGWNGIDNWYCVRASTAMINDYYGGTLTQDRISVYAFEQLNTAWYGSPANLRGVPEHDLGFGTGIGDYGIQESVLSWALGGAQVTPINYCPPNPNDGKSYTCPNPNGAPMSFADVKNLIDAGRPFMSINLRNAHARVVDGYWEISTASRWVHLIDPVPADTNACPTCTNAQWLSYATFAATHERAIVPPAGVPSPRQDEAAIKLDSDGDGISNYDESERFHTNPNNPDTDGDWVPDKADMAEYIFNTSAEGTYVYTPGMNPKTSDFDSDGKRKELDWDNDGDGVPDGCEDTNLDGEFDAGESSNFNKNSSQLCQPRFAIVDPRTGQAANAGDPANPDKVLIRLSVALPPALPNKPAFTAGQFSATIGGKSAATISGAQVGQEFWLLVQAPAQDSSSFFDLAVAFNGATTGHANQSDSETNAVYYIPRPRVDTLVVLDRSGSMSLGGKLDAAKNAARLYIDQWTTDDRVGVVSFADNASVDLALTAVQANGAALTSAKNAVNAAAANGQTALGAGLLAGQQQLTGGGDAGHDWSLMLLTDGQENVAPFWNDPAVSNVIIPSKTVVNTIGLGEPTAAWFGLLQQIAGATGGVFGAVNDPAAVQAAASASIDQANAMSAFPTTTANQLADAYKYAAEQMLGEQRIYEAAGTVVAGGACAVHRFQVGAVPTVAFTANYAIGGRARLDVYRPTAVKVASSDAGVEYRTDATHEQYRVDSSQGSLAGLWRVEVCPLGTPGTVALGTEYALFGAADDPLTLNLAVGEVTTINGAAGVIGLAPVVAILADTQPVTGASVQLQVVAPGGQPVGSPLTLLDDGQHGDGAAGDGIYGGTAQMPARGTYLLKATASVGGAGYRHAQASVQY